MARRIYIVTAAAGTAGAALSPRLVRAHSQAQAIRHVARDYSAEVAGQDDLVTSLTAGIKVEDAGEESRSAPAEDATGVLESDGGTPD